MMVWIAWLIGTKLGRLVAEITLITAVVGIVLLRARQSGVEAERLKQLQKALEALRTRMKVDEEITQLPADERLRRLNKWLSE